MAPTTHPPVFLFGYDSSPFTNKVRLALKLKQVPFTYIPVPSMLPRPLLTKTFGLSYRKIPVVAIGREIYCDTSLIIEALEHYFPSTSGWGTVYPKYDGVDEWVYKGLARGFASFWADKPLFRTTTGLIPPSVWESPFGADRAQLIGHTLDPSKLAAKIPANLSALDTQLSMLEPTFKLNPNGEAPWAMPTEKPSLADISLYYQLRWGMDIAAGKGVYNLTGGAAAEGQQEDVMSAVFNQQRYPGVSAWFRRLETYLAGLPDLSTTVDGEADTRWKQSLEDAPLWEENEILVSTSAETHAVLDEKLGLVPGASVSIAPDDTGRGNPTTGTLVAAGVEEVAITPFQKGELDVRIHFPRLGFVVKVVEESKL